MAPRRGRSSSSCEDSRQEQSPPTPSLRSLLLSDNPVSEARRRADSAPVNSHRRRRSSARRGRGNSENESPRLQRPDPLNPRDVNSIVNHARYAWRLSESAELETLETYRREVLTPAVQNLPTSIEDTSRVSTPIMASSSAFPALDTSVSAAGNRSAGVSPTGPSSMNGSNGINGPSAATAAAYMPPLPVGHQQDLNHLFNQIQELGTLLRSNRDKVNSITKDAEEVAKRANGALTNGEDAGTAENDKARIRELELELSKQKHLVELYKHEQKENTGLIALYEEAMGTAVEQIRNYCGDIEGRFLRQRKHYNDLLQAEKDEHLASRLDRDHWHAQTVKVCEMIRTAHRLRSEEWNEEYAIVAALQGEVRILRRVFDMEPQAPEEETGWPYLKDLPLPE